jgi:UDP-GlcNAc:undecaprenyl-phosphate GlcNAc-1-phosphate transferase
MFILTITTALAALVSLLLTPGVISISRRIGLMDAPDGHRKLQARSVPLGGGVVLLISFVIGIAALLVIPHEYTRAIEGQWKFLAGLAGAALVICGVGLLDDYYGLRGRQKFLGQVLAVSVLLPFDIVIDKIVLFGFTIELGLLAIPFTYFWMLGAINALNLIDGADGLATTIGTVVCLALCILGWITGHIPEAIVAMVFLGSMLGFLVFNLPPARIFLGDAGSMQIGLILAALAIRGSFKGPATVAMAAPLAIWSLLILDTSMAILRRKLTGRSLYTTDRGHMHHVLQNRGIRGGKMVAWMGMLCAISCGAALLSVTVQNETVALGTIAAIAIVLALTRVFGHSEVALLARKTKHFVSTFIPHPDRKLGGSTPFSSRLQGHSDWESHWNELRDFAQRFDLLSVQLDINIPSIHEEFHASWTRRRITRESHIWRLATPIKSATQVLGRVLLVGEAAESSAVLTIVDLSDGLKQFEVDVVNYFQTLIPQRELDLQKETLTLKTHDTHTLVFDRANLVVTDVPQTESARPE